MERTLVLLKPDAVQRGLVGKIITEFEEKGLKIVGLKLWQMTREIAESHYGEHRDKPFFQGLVDYITSGPLVVMALEGKSAVAAVRQMMGATNPLQASPGTIRGRYGLDIGRNVVHGSDSVASAARELAIFFEEYELISYPRVIEQWIYE